MAFYTVRAPDGKLIKLQGPEGATDQEVIAQAQRLYRPTAELPEEAPEEKPGSLLDIPLQVAQGVSYGVRGVTDVFGAENVASKGLRKVEDYLGELLSAQGKDDQAKISQIFKDAEDKGLGAQLGAAWEAFKAAPVSAASQALGTALPTVAGGAGAKVLQLGKVGIRGTQALIGAAMGTGIVKGSIYDAVNQQLLEAGATEEQAAKAASQAQSYAGDNLGMIGTGGFIGAITGGTGIEPALAGAVSKNIAKSFVGRVATGAVAEAVPEVVQGGQERLAQNLALQNAGFDVPTTRGVVGAGAYEGLVGGVLGGGIGAIRGDRSESRAVQEPVVPPVPEDISGEFTPEAIAQGEQEAQAAARERMALSAIDTGEFNEDEGFQPDLFAAQLEQERRRVQPVSEGETPLSETSAPTAAAEEQPNLFGQYLSDTNELARMQAEEDLANATTAAQKQAAEAKLARLRQESEFESLSLGQGAEQLQVSEASRRAILLDTIQNTPTNNYNTLTANFSRALADQGFARVEPTEAELSTIKRAVDVQRAEPEVSPPAPPLQEIKTAPGGAAALEAFIPEDVAKPLAEPVQPSFEGMGRRKVAQAPEPSVTPEPKIITTEDLDNLGISPQAPIRKRVIGKDLNEPAVRQQFVDFTKNQNVGQEARLNIARMLEGAPDEQMELFQPRRPAGEPRVRGRERGVSPVGGETTAAGPAAATTELGREGLGGVGGTAQQAGSGKAGKPGTLETKPAPTPTPYALAGATPNIDVAAPVVLPQNILDLAEKDYVARKNLSDNTDDSELGRVPGKYKAAATMSFRRLSTALKAFEPNEEKRLQILRDLYAKDDARETPTTAQTETETAAPAPYIKPTPTLPPAKKTKKDKGRVFTGPSARAEAEAAYAARGPQGVTAERAEATSTSAYRKLLQRPESAAPTTRAAAEQLFTRSTPEFNAKRREVVKALQARLRAVGLSDVALRLPDFIRSGDINGDAVNGFYDPLAKVVQLSLENKNLANTLDHEIIHALRDMGLFTDREWAALSKKAEADWIKKYDIEKRYGHLDREGQIEEAVAEAFADHISNKQPLDSMYKVLADKARRLFNIVRSVFSGNGFTTPETVFSRVERGKIGGRERSAKPIAGRDIKLQKKVEEAKTALEKIRESRTDKELAGSTGAILASSRNAKDVGNFLSRTYSQFKSTTARSATLFVLNTDDLFRSAKANIGKSVQNIEELREAFDGADILRHRLIFAGLNISDRITEYNAKAKDGGSSLADVILGSTIEQVDLDKAMPKDASKSVKELYDVWKAVPEDGRKLYRDIFAFFDKQRSEQYKLTIENLNRSALPKEAKEAAIKAVEADFKELARVTRYFPLIRPGKYWLRMGSGSDYRMVKFDTAVGRDIARDRYVKNLKAAGDKRSLDDLFADKDIASGDDMHSLRLDLENRPDTILSKINKIVERADDKNAKEEIADSVFQLYMNSLSGEDIARHWAPRDKDSPAGFTTDINRAFSARAITAANHMARLAYNDRINNLIGGMYEAARGRANSDELMPFIDEMAARAKRITEPVTEDTIWDSIARNGNKLVWVWMLTAPKSGVMNFVQVPTVAMPTMAAELKMPDGSQLGYARASAALAKNFGVVFGIVDGGKIGARFAAKKNDSAPKLGEALDDIYKTFEADGRWSTTFVADMNSISREASPTQTQDPWSKVGRGTKKALDWMTSIFQMTESRSRQLVGMTAAEIEYVNAIKAEKTHEEAIELAKTAALRMTNEGMFNYATWNRSSLMTGAGGRGAAAAAAKLATQFSSYPIAYTSYILRNAYTMFKGLNKAERKEAATKLFGTLGMVGMFGGVSGMGWLYGITMGMLSAFGASMDEEDDGDESNPLLNRNADAWFKKHFLPTYFGPGSGLAKTFGLDEKSAEILMSSIYSGPVSALTGADFSSSVRIELPFQKALPFDSIFFSNDFPDVSDRNAFESAVFHLASGPAGGLITQMQSGLSDMYKGDFVRGAEQMLPAVVRGPVRAYRFATEGSLTREGAEIKNREWFTTGMLLQQAGGFNVTELSELQRMTFQLKTAAKAIEADRTKVYDKFDRAIRSRNEKAMKEAQEALRDFNEENPLVPIMPSQLRASVFSQSKGRAGAIYGVQPTKRYRGLYADVLGSDEEEYEE